MKTQGHHSVDSMTKREDFAKAAMKAMLENGDLQMPGNVSKRAVEHADALIAALNEEKKQ